MSALNRFTPDTSSHKYIPSYEVHRKKAIKATRCSWAHMVMQLLDHMKLIQSHISTLKHYLSCLRGKKVNLDFLNTFQIPSFSP